MTILILKFLVGRALAQIIQIIVIWTLSQPSRGRNRLYTSKSDVCRRQILTYKDDFRAERIKIFIMVVDP